MNVPLLCSDLEFLKLVFSEFSPSLAFLKFLLDDLQVLLELAVALFELQVQHDITMHLVS